MSRPMPGPPDRASHDRHSAAGFIRSDCPWCRSFRPDESKRLTDAECAAEYWRAQFDCEDYTLSDGYGDGIRAPRSGTLWWPRDAMNNERRLATWHRFVAHPHALEPTP